MAKRNDARAAEGGGPRRPRRGEGLAEAVGGAAAGRIDVAQGVHIYNGNHR
jgi:hypothetical protein